ncbi:MAG: GNAT family N-acetyltransferase [Solirubrobacteraceae bacterium]|nr:GNAT family N-acetyltransferase [Solirubrobacteraceae bacterium]
MTTFIAPVELRRDGLLLTPLGPEHAPGLAAAAADGELWTRRYTSVPEPGQELAWIELALSMREAGSRLAFAVIDETTGSGSGTVLGSTSYHDLVPEIRRAEIGYTWYAARTHRTRVNTTCKLMLLEHAFEVEDCGVVGWRTSSENTISQTAIAALGAKLDGTIRRHQQARDGGYRDTVFFSMLPDEWPAAKAALEARLAKYA